LAGRPNCIVCKNGASIQVPFPGLSLSTVLRPRNRIHVRTGGGTPRLVPWFRSFTACKVRGQLSTSRGVSGSCRHGQQRARRPSPLVLPKTLVNGSDPKHTARSGFRGGNQSKRQPSSGVRGRLATTLSSKVQPRVCMQKRRNAETSRRRPRRCAASPREEPSLFRAMGYRAVWVKCHRLTHRDGLAYIQALVVADPAGRSSENQGQQPPTGPS
jgi:hypothetical protein